MYTWIQYIFSCMYVVIHVYIYIRALTNIITVMQSTVAKYLFAVKTY